MLWACPELFKELRCKDVTFDENSGTDRPAEMLLDIHRVHPSRRVSAKTSRLLLMVSLVSSSQLASVVIAGIPSNQRYRYLTIDQPRLKNRGLGVGESRLVTTHTANLN